MKAQCPNCKTIFPVPDTYEGKFLKCTKCNEGFTAKIFKRPPIVVPTHHVRHKNIIKKIWTKSPLAYRTGFLTTLGVISALTLSAYVYRLKLSSHPSLDAESTYPVYSTSSSIQGTGNMLRSLCKLHGELELTGHLKNPLLSERTRDLLITRLNNNKDIFLNIKWFGRDSQLFEKAINSLKDAMQAEIDVLIYERQNPEICKNGAWYYDKDYMKLMNKSIELRSEASMQIYKLMNKI